MTEVDGSSVGLTASSIVCCGLGSCHPETLTAGCVLTQPSAGCHCGFFSCSLWRDNVQHVDAPHAFAQQYGCGEHCRFRFTANADRNLIWCLVCLCFCPFETLAYYIFSYQFSTSLPSFSLDISRTALLSACESVVATLFWKHVNVLTTHLPVQGLSGLLLVFCVAASQNTTTHTPKKLNLTRIMTCCLSQAWYVRDIANLCPPWVCSCWKVAASSRKTMFTAAA